MKDDNTPFTVAVPLLLWDSDSELSCMDALQQVVATHDLTREERARIAAWFASRYGATPTPAQPGCPA
jgi:hypothetical protein